MNTLRPLMIVAVLAAIGYGVYVRINGGHDGPPPGANDSWDAAPRVMLSENDSSSGGSAWSPGGGNAPLNRSNSAATARRGDAPPFGSAAPAANRPSPPAEWSGPPLENNVDLNQAPPYQSQTRDPYAADPGGNPGDRTMLSPQAGSDPRANDNYRPQSQTPAGPTFSMSFETAQRELEAGKMANALQELSAWYDDPRLSPAEQQLLLRMLDQVAGSVVYSTQHHLEPAYEVQAGERLEDIAQRFDVPWQLLAKINGIDDPQTLRPGERLKVVRGPFTAVISLDKRQLTLMVNNSYAGRFPVGLGRENPPQVGSYSVSDKVANPVYQGRDRVIGGGDQNNPLGDRWIGLGSELGIHGTNRADTIGRADGAGSISLSQRDIDDVYDILTIGSKVIIRR